MGELKNKIDALSTSDKIKLANFLQVNMVNGVTLTTHNQKNRVFNVFDLFISQVNADVFSFLQDKITAQQLIKFSRIGVGATPFIASAGAIAIGANMVRLGPLPLQRIQGAVLAIGGAVALLLATLDAIAQTTDMFLPKQSTLFGQVIGQSASNQLTSIRLRGTFIPVDSLPINQSLLVLSAINRAKNENIYISNANNSINLFNSSLSFLSSSLAIENIPPVTFPQTTVPGFLSPSYITSATIIGPLDGSVSIESYSTTSEIVGVVISSDKSQTVKVKLVYANNDLGVNLDIIVNVDVIADPSRAVIHYTKDNLVVNFDSTDPQNPNVNGLTYSWDFGDGQTGNTTSKTLSHNYLEAGTYNVSLTVTDAFGASDTTSVSVFVQSSVSNLTICNGGLSPIKMSFDLEEVVSFTLEHIYKYDSNGQFIGSTCECKKLSVPNNVNIGIHVEGIYSLQVIPYDGLISVSVNQQVQQYFTNGEINYPPGYVGPQVFTIVRGVYYNVRCNNVVYK